jgi:hypothetical protein
MSNEEAPSKPNKVCAGFLSELHKIVAVSLSEPYGNTPSEQML